MSLSTFTYSDSCSCCLSQAEATKVPYTITCNTNSFPTAYSRSYEIPALSHHRMASTAISHLSPDYSYNESSANFNMPHMTSVDSCGHSRETTPEPTDEETEIWLRKNLSIPEPLPLNLWSLPDSRPGVKSPKISDLIKLAIWGSRERKLTLRQIYAAVEERYPSYKTQEDKPWQRSIRHNLSLKAMFVSVERPSLHPGKGHYWKLNVKMGDCNTRERKRMVEKERLLQEEDNYHNLMSFHNSHPLDQPLRRPDVPHIDSYSLVPGVSAAFDSYNNVSMGIMQSPTQSYITHTSFSGHTAPSRLGFVSPASQRDQHPTFDSAMPFTGLSIQQQWLADMYHDAAAGHLQQNFSDQRTSSVIFNGVPIARDGYMAGASRPLKRAHSQMVPDVELRGAYNNHGHQ